jgi:quinol monooxygenase YgiN
MEEQVVIVALVKAKAGFEDKVKEELLALIKPTKEEEGCIGYNLHEEVGNKTDFMFYEIWRSQKDIDAHFQTPHIKALIEKSAVLFEEPVTVTMWKRIDTQDS